MDEIRKDIEQIADTVADVQSLDPEKNDIDNTIDTIADSIHDLDVDESDGDDIDQVAELRPYEIEVDAGSEEDAAEIELMNDAHDGEDSDISGEEVSEEIIDAVAESMMIEGLEEYLYD